MTTPQTPTPTPRITTAFEADKSKHNKNLVDNCCFFRADNLLREGQTLEREVDALTTALHRCLAATGEEAGDMDDFRALVDREEHVVKAVQELRSEFDQAQEQLDATHLAIDSLSSRVESTYDLGVSNGKQEALKYTPEERDNYGKFVAQSTLFRDLQEQLRQLDEQLTAALDARKTAEQSLDEITRVRQTEIVALRQAEQRAKDAEKACAGMADSWQRGERYDCQPEHWQEYGYNYVQKSKLDEAIKALDPFAALLQNHHQQMPDSRPVFEINGKQITVGNLRNAQALAAAEKVTKP